MFSQLATTFFEILSAPIKHPILLWVLIPVYINWIISDIYQERKGTKLGNAISNGFVALWVGLDWGRQLTSQFVLSSESLFKIALVGFFIMYGLSVIITGLRGKEIVKYVGRIREITYAIICLTPIFYGFVPLSINTILSIIVFFPVFYIIFEVVMRVTPSPENV